MTSKKQLLEIKTIMVKGFNKLDKEIDNFVKDALEVIREKQSLSYLAGIRDASLKGFSPEEYPYFYENAQKFESLKLSNPEYDIPMKELRRIARYM